ncbi:hypothetical protein TNCV_1773771 [Trichonephila clavipes]|nr:hypothetical protein TNCV_1773771 [Trichonephila clavipes]
MVLHLGGKFLSFLAWLRAKRLLSDWMLGTVNIDSDWLPRGLESEEQRLSLFMLGCEGSVTPNRSHDWPKTGGHRFLMKSYNSIVSKIPTMRAAAAAKPCCRHVLRHSSITTRLELSTRRHRTHAQRLSLDKQKRVFFSENFTVNLFVTHVFLSLRLQTESSVLWVTISFLNECHEGSSLATYQRVVLVVDMGTFSFTCCKKGVEVVCGTIIVSQWMYHFRVLILLWQLRNHSSLCPILLSRLFLPQLVHRRPSKVEIRLAFSTITHLV